MLESLAEKYKDSANVQWDYERENIYSLAKADVMISDFSGIIFDYVFLRDKPVLYIKQGLDIRAYDADDLEENQINKLWQFKALAKIGLELKEDQFDHIGEVIKELTNSADLRNARETAKQEAWQYPGEAGKLVAEFMIKTVEG
jgi:CDP-glycerol glycerophosphotransferase (TagB/SpsB family)